MPKIYLISDTHFNCWSMIFFGKRPFKNLKEMHNTLIKNWNDTVNKNDTVIIVGDFGKGNAIFFKWLLKKLNGKKILIKGNHDYKFRLKKILKTETIKIYKEIQLKIKNTNILITHKPQNKNKRLFDINIHGHHHKKLLPKRFLQDYYYNVAAEHNYYKPKLLIDIIKNKGICTKGIDIDEIIGQILYNNKKNLVLA